MKKILFLSIVLFLSNCTLNKVVQHHGVHNLEKKQLKLRVNNSNKNDIIKIIGPPSTKSSFENDVFIYIERKTSSSKLTKLGKKILLVNNVLVLEINNKGILIDKKFYDKNSMQQIDFAENTTNTDYTKRSFIYNFLSSLELK